MKIGAIFPHLEIEVDSGAIRAYAQAVEEIGYDHLIAYDHVLGADVTNRPNWFMPYTSESRFHEPLVLFSYLAGVTKSLGLATGVMISPQRQAALVAKQASNLDIFCNGRLRLGLGSGWNEIEYEALGVAMAKRGKRLDEQIDFIRRLWTDMSFSYDGEFHKLTEGGINPLPIQRPIPVWIGGISEAAFRRAVRLGDGWLPVLQAGDAASTVSRFDEALTEAGREAGAGAVGIHTMGAALSGAQSHIDFLRKVKARL